MPYQVRVSTKMSCTGSVKDQSEIGSRTTSPESQSPGRWSRGAQPTRSARERATARHVPWRLRMARDASPHFWPERYRAGRSGVGREPRGAAGSTPPGRDAKLPGSAQIGRRGMKLATMAERFERPAWVRRINAMGDSVGGAWQLLPLDAQALRANAASSLGEEFGEFGDPRWRERFAALVAALDAAELTTVGRLLTRQELLRSLRSRHLLASAWDEGPGIAGEPIRAPVIVTGPARSGTSILFELLWLDPAFRAPLAWEALHPLPLPGEAGDRRAETSECEQELWADVQPEFAAIHELRSDLPVECVTLTAPCFCGPHWPMCVQMPGWAPDVPEMYRFHRRILQVLQHGSEARTWLLKTPGHLMTLDLVFATYPDAWVVQTHRDPARTMPSTVSTTAMVQWLRSERVDVEA